MRSLENCSDKTGCFGKRNHHSSQTFHVSLESFIRQSEKSISNYNIKRLVDSAGSSNRSVKGFDLTPVKMNIEESVANDRRLPEHSLAAKRDAAS